MTIPISSEAAEALMAFARQGCPDGGVAECYDCARKAIAKVLPLLDLHPECVRLPNFTIDKTTQTGTNAGGTV